MMSVSQSSLAGLSRLNPARQAPLSRNLGGFTIVELLVSIFIVVLITGLFMVNYHSAEKRLKLNVVKQKLASDIRVAQNNSLGEKTYASNAVTKGGWGVHFDLSNPTSYLIFTDQDVPNGNRAYDNGEAVEIKNLPSEIFIDSLKVNEAPVDSLNITFLPPDPITFINAQTYSRARITLKESVNNSTASVTVNFFGLIDVE